MAKFDILEDLKWRGAINQETDEEGLRKYLAEHDDLALEEIPNGWLPSSNLDRWWYWCYW